MASRKTIHHPTICRTFPVPVQCESCCSLFHCPFCSPRFFKPTRQDKLMSHLSGHLKKAVVHGDFTIHRCGLQCRKGLHYHCLYCAGMLLRRDTFEHHLQHCKNTMTSGPTQPLTYGPTPSLTYGPTPSLTYGPTPPQAYVPAPPMPSVPAPPMPSGTTRKVHSNKMHITIQEGRCLPELKKCTTCCKDFHCPFCSAAVFHPAKWSKIRSHLESHFNRAVLHEGYTIHRCGLDCRPQWHYHCVHCQSMLSRRADFVKHLSMCKKKHPLQRPPPQSGQEGNTSHQDGVKAEPSTNMDGTTNYGSAMSDGKFFGFVSQPANGKAIGKPQRKRRHSDSLNDLERRSGGKNTKRPHTVTQGQLDSLITSYVVKGMHPLSTVEQTEFVALIHGLSPNTTVISRQTLQRKIESDFIAKKRDLKEKLRTVQCVCTTADIWSTGKTSVMGVTAHWIKPDATERESVVLACRPFQSPHTCDRVGELLDEIHSEFGLSNEKIVATVTDNGSNVVKAYEEFGISVIADEENEMKGDGLTFITIRPSEEPSAGGLFRPPQVRCATHMLGLVCTTDVKQAMEDSPTLSRLNQSAMGKCSALWNASKTPKTAELLLEATKEPLKTPCPTRWNSLYDSLRQLSHLRDKLLEIMSTLDLPAFNEAELDYLGEYCIVLRPIAMAVDRLQSQDSCYYGELIPTLFAVQAKLYDLQVSNLRYTSTLLQAILGGFESRFCSYLQLTTDVNEAILATTTHPFFKMRWIPPRLSGEKWRIHQLLLRSVEELDGMVAESEVPSSDHQDDEEEDFFVFSPDETDTWERPEIITSHSQAEFETLRFLEDSRRELRSLELYPRIKLLFGRFNTTLPSSAPVERLFSFAGVSSRRLTPEMFEKLVVLNGN